MGHGKDFPVVLRMPWRGEAYLDLVERDLTTKKLPNKRVLPWLLAFVNHQSGDGNWSRIGTAEAHKIIINKRRGDLILGAVEGGWRQIMVLRATSRAIEGRRRHIRIM